MCLVELLVTNPRKRFGLPMGEDFSVWRVDEEFTVDPADFASMGHATPFEGWTVHAECKLTVCGDRIAYENL